MTRRAGPPRCCRRRTRGAALLMAMLTVTLVATFAAAALWQQWRAIEIEAAERARSQSSWLLTGALDWARLILRQDARAASRSSPTDHLAEPWAIPLQESRLSTFLAAQGGVAMDSGEDLPEVFVSGRIIDLQSRLNIYNLIANGKPPTETDIEPFKRLFDHLSLPQQELFALIQGLALSLNEEPNADVPLRPQRFDQLRWLGLAPATLQALAPHATLLPERTSINLNTASTEVIAASTGLDLSDAELLLAARTRNQFNKLEDAATVIARPVSVFDASRQGVASTYFEVQGRLRMATTIVNERSLVHRTAPNGFNVTANTVWRERWAGEEPR